MGRRTLGSWSRGGGSRARVLIMVAEEERRGCGMLTQVWCTRGDELGWCRE